MGQIEVDLYNFIPMFRYDPNLTRDIRTDNAKLNIKLMN